MVPPHERPTFQAVSSATPNSRVLGLPVSITSMASVTTAPSTQPPETEPRKFPSPSITRLEPTGRRAAPQVSTTVASATSRPCRRQSSAALRMSSSRASVLMLKPPGSVSCFDPLYRNRYGSALRDLPQPGLGVAAVPVGQGAHQLGHGFEIV